MGLHSHSHNQKDTVYKGYPKSHHH